MILYAKIEENIHGEFRKQIKVLDSDSGNEMTFGQ